jgi:hypothetical protein
MPSDPYDQTQAPFFTSLPAELRDQIYDILLGGLRLTALDFQSIRLEVDDVVALPAVCKRMQSELRDVARRRIPYLIKPMAPYSIYPLKEGQWASQLASTGRLCPVCEPVSSVQFGAVYQMWGSKTPPITPLAIRLIPCACWSVRQGPEIAMRDAQKEHKRAVAAGTCCCGVPAPPRRMTPHGCQPAPQSPRTINETMYRGKLVAVTSFMHWTIFAVSGEVTSLVSGYMNKRTRKAGAA